MKMNLRNITSIAIVSITVLLLNSCSSDPNSPGLEYMPDMYRSPAIEPYVDYGEIRGRENKEVKMLLSAKTPPMGTIPYYGTDEQEVSLMLPYARKANTSFELSHGMFGAELTDVDEYTLAAADMNPLKLTADNSEAIFAEGKELFMNNCSHCHGAKGDGNGPMMENGSFAGVPDYANLKELSDGQLFYSIYYGKGAMGAHRSIINKKEIWTIVHQIRSLQNPDYGKFDSTTTMATEVIVDSIPVEVEIEEHH